MSEYYTNEDGSLYERVYGNKLRDVDKRKLVSLSTSNLTSIIYFQFIELKKIKKERRWQAYQVFQLKEKDVCIVDDEVCEITEKYFYLFDVVTKKNNEMKIDVKLNEISLIKEKNYKYYIYIGEDRKLQDGSGSFLSEHLIKGTIVVEFKNDLFIYSSWTWISVDIRRDIDEISYEFMKVLEKENKARRMKTVERKINTKWNYNGDLVTIIEMNIEGESVKYKVENERKTRFVVEVDDLIPKNGNLNLFTAEIIVTKKMTGSPYEYKKGFKLLNPDFVEEVNKKWKGNKIMKIQSERESIFVIMKWQGYINKKIHFGCELLEEHNFGTNGDFNGHKLFNGKENHCVLINGETVKKHCLNGKHNYFETKNDLFCKEQSICCAEELDSVKDGIRKDTRIVIKKHKIIGSCCWVGKFNGKNVVVFDLLNENRNYEFLRLESLFNCGRRGLMVPENLCEQDVLVLHDCIKFPYLILDPFEKHEEYVLGYNYERIVLHGNDRYKVKWKGVVKEELIIGLELNYDVEIGTNGIFGGIQLFNCADHRGVLTPIWNLPFKCEEGEHRDIDNVGKLKCLDEKSICCIMKTDICPDWPELKVGRNVIVEKIKFQYWPFGNKEISGTCRWIGLINGKSCIGVEMDDKQDGGTSGRFRNVDLFQCENGKGFLFSSNILKYDKDSEKLNYIKQNIIDHKKLRKLTESSKHELVDKFIQVKSDNEILQGELMKVVKSKGIDIEIGVIYLCEQHDLASDGIINGVKILDCDPGHCLLTPLTEIKKCEEMNTFVDDLLNPRTYLTFNSQENGQFKINDVVFTNFNNKKHKSVIKWTGIVNDEFVVLVKLSKTYYDDDHPLNKYMTYGKFFRHQIVECREKRIVGVKLNQISPFEPYTSKPIPEDKVFFPEIDIDSSVRDVINELYGTVKWIGCDYEEENWFYGVEMENRINEGTDGTFKKQRLFKCGPGFGKLYHIGFILPDSRHVGENVYIEYLPKSEICDRYQAALPIRSYDNCVGDNRGIQGNQNSCFFDSALFALFSHTDVLDFMINPINPEIIDENTIEFRDILWQRIICSLRKYGFVSLHQFKILRETVEKFGPKYKEMMNQVSDMENISSILSKLCPNTQLVRLKSFSGAENQSMFIQLFVTIPRKIEYLSTQKMLELHMIQNNILFLEEPKCLIFQAPRNALGINTYEHILPLNKIEISKLSYERFRKCYDCEDEAMFSCSECVEQNETYELTAGFRCNRHKCTAHKINQNLPRYEGPVRSKNKVYLTLTSIICIKSAHFVSYVRDPITDQWYFFDSMSKKRKYVDVTIPCVEEARTIKDFVMKDEEDMIEQIGIYRDEHLHRITKFGYVFVYKNNAKLCY